MQGKLIAILLSCLIVTIPAYAEQNPNPIKAQSTLAPSSKIDLNKADLSQLTGSFKGVGKKRAQAIIDYRNKQGEFKSIDDLAKIKGFGKKFVEKNRDKLAEVYTMH